MSKRTAQRALRAEGYQRRVIRKAIQLRVPNKRNTAAWYRGKLHLPVIGYWDIHHSLMNVKWRLGLTSESTFGEGLEKNGTRRRMCF